MGVIHLGKNWVDPVRSVSCLDCLVLLCEYSENPGARVGKAPLSGRDWLLAFYPQMFLIAGRCLCRKSVQVS